MLSSCLAQFLTTPHSQGISIFMPCRVCNHALRSFRVCCCNFASLTLFQHFPLIKHQTCDPRTLALQTTHDFFALFFCYYKLPETCIKGPRRSVKSWHLFFFLGRYFFLCIGNCDDNSNHKKSEH